MTSPPMRGKIKTQRGNVYMCRVAGESEKVQSSPIIVFEGILSLYDVRIRELMDIKIFVLTDDDIRLSRRCKG
jgi:uridine kinase